MSTTSTQYQYLSPRPTSSYRQFFVTGTRICARTLYGLYAGADAMTPEEIAADYGLPVAAVREAIAYCESDPPEIQEDFARDEALMEATGMNDPDYRLHPSPKLLSPQERAKLSR